MLPSLTSLGQALSSPQDPKVTPCSPKVELDSSSKKRDHKSSSKSHKHPVSMAAGSHADLEKSKQECEAMCKQLERECEAENRQRERSRECEDHAHSKSKSSHHMCTSEYEHSQASKHSISVEPSSSMECLHPKEWWVESQSRSHDHESRCTCSPKCIRLLPPPFFHSTPVTSHHASTVSLGIQPFNMSRGSLPPDHGSLNIEMFAPPPGTITPPA